MLFATNFIMDFSSFKINPKSNKYLFDTLDLILLMWYNEATRPEIENENEEDIENSSPWFFLSKKGF